MGKLLKNVLLFCAVGVVAITAARLPTEDLGGPMGKSCLPEFSNQCRTDADCCTNFCSRPGSWAFGVCRSRGACKPDWDNQCKQPSDCCSNNCDRPPSWEWGVCHPPK